MENVTRRNFIQGATVLAAGAAVGIPAYRGLKEHGPIDLRMYIFSKDPIIIKVMAFSDEKKDLFGIRAFGHKVEMRMLLSKVKKVMEPRFFAVSGAAEFEAEDGVIERRAMIISRNGDDITFHAADSMESAPLWVKISDVQRVL